MSNTQTGSVRIGAGDTFHPALRQFGKVTITCRCESARDKDGRPPAVFHPGKKANCPGSARSKS